MKERFYLFFNKDEIEILLNSLNILKELNNLPEKNEILDNLINRIYESIQSHLDEDLINRKEVSNKDYFDPMYNELISLFNKAKEPITISIDENIKYANSAFCKMLGYESENEIIELGLFNMISKRCLPIIKNFYKNRSKGEIAPNIHDLELKRADGSTILIECIHYCMPFKGLNLMITFYIGLTKLKSLEKKLRKSEEKYRSLFTCSIEGVLISNIEGKVSSVNPAAVSLLGYDDPEELIGMPALNVYFDPSRREPIVKGMIETGYVKDFEIKLKKKDGTPIDTICNATLHKDEDGNLLRIEAFFKDITERKQAEDNLSLISEILTNMAEGVYLIRTNDGIITYTNPKFEKMFGYKQGEMIGKNVSIVNAPTDKSPEETAKEITEILERTGEWHGEVKNIKKDGTPFWCYANVSTFDHHDHGRVWVSVHTDISERKRVEQKLKESEEKWRALSENSPAYITLSDREHIILFINRTPPDLSREEVIGTPLHNHATQEFRQIAIDYRDSVWETGKPVTYTTKYITKEGDVRYFDVWYGPVFQAGKVIALVSHHMDVTERKEVEQKLKESEEKYRVLFENSPVGIGLATLKGKVFTMNKAMENITSYTLEEYDKVNLKETYVDPNQRDLMINLLKKQGNLRDYEIKLKRKDETEYNALMNIDLIELDGEDVLLTNVRDITQIKKAEQKLKESEEKWRSMTENSPDFIITLNKDENIKFINKIEVLSLGMDDVIGKPVYNFIPEKSKNSAKECFKRVLKSGQNDRYYSDFIYDDGTIHHFESRVGPVLKEGKVAGFTITSTDITDRKRAEQKLRESEEKYRNAYNQADFYKDLFAHDLNNILNNIGTSEELISIFLNNPDKLNDIKKYLNIVKEQVTRGAILISNVQKLSQLEESEISIKSLEVCNVLKDAIQFTREGFPTRNISVQIDSIGKKLFVQANDLLLDVFENLLNNAIKFSNNPQIEILIRISRIQKEGFKYLRIEFVDNGIGIPDDRKEVIFQRAYEKDKSVRGMGLGLSLVKKIIEIYKGDIWIEDKVKGDYTKGSNFVLLIPEVV